MSRIDFVTGAPSRYMPLVDRLATIPERTAALVAAANPAALAREPAEGEWTAARILAHMASYARHNHTFLLRMAWMTDPVRTPWDEEAEVEAEGWLALTPRELVGRLQQELAPTIELLSETPDASWGRPGSVPGHGRRSLRQQVERHIDHFEEHLAQLERVLGVSAAGAAASR